MSLQLFQQILRLTSLLFMGEFLKSYYKKLILLVLVHHNLNLTFDEFYMKLE